MINNVGSTDRILRIVIGVIAIALGVLYGTWWGAIGLIPIITAIIGWCPTYSLFHLSTCRTADKKPA